MECTLNNLDAQGLNQYRKYLTGPGLGLDFSKFSDIARLQELIGTLSDVPSSQVHKTMKLNLAKQMANVLFAEHYHELSKFRTGSGLTHDILASASEYNASKGTLSGFDLYKSVLDRLGYSSYVSNFEIEELEPFNYRFVTDIQLKHISSTFHVQHPIGMLLDVFNNLVLDIDELYSTSVESQIMHITCDDEDIVRDTQVLETNSGTKLTRSGLTGYLNTPVVQTQDVSSQSGTVNFFLSDFGLLDVQSRDAQVKVQVKKTQGENSALVSKVFIQGVPNSKVELTITTDDRQMSNISYVLGQDTTFQLLDLNTIRATLTKQGYRPETVHSCFVNIVRRVSSVQFLEDNIEDTIVYALNDALFDTGMLNTGLSTVSGVTIEQGNIIDEISFLSSTYLQDTLTTGRIYNLDTGYDTTSGVILQDDTLSEELSIIIKTAKWSLDTGYDTTSGVTVSV